MGTQLSRIQNNSGNSGQKKPGLLNRFMGQKTPGVQGIPSPQQPGIFNRLMGTPSPQQQSRILPPPQVSGILDLQFILKNPPLQVDQPQQINQKNKAQNSQKLASIIKKMIEYNKTWNFGNQPNGQPQSLLKQETYESFLSFVRNLLNPTNPFTPPPTGMKNENAYSFAGKKSIVQEINNLIKGGSPPVNQFFPVKISVIFPGVPGVKQEDEINVTLLGLAAIIGAEHLVIYFLMCGANPSLTFGIENKDSATLMLSYQLALCKLQQPSANSKYFIILPRILYILFLLGSVGEGIDLSEIFVTNELKNKVNLSGTQQVPMQSSILNMLAKMPGGFTVPVEKQTLQNGGSIPLLLEILERNNSLDKPKFFKDINLLEKPYDLNVLYNVLLNTSIDNLTKIRLVELLVIKYCGNIANVPTFTVKNSRTTTFEIILAIVNGITADNNLKAKILQIFSENQNFRDILTQSGIDLNQFTTQNTNNNKNRIILELTAKLQALQQKNSVIMDQVEQLIKLQQAQIMKTIATAETNALLQQQPIQQPQRNLKNAYNSFKIQQSPQQLQQQLPLQQQQQFPLQQQQQLSLQQQLLLQQPQQLSPQRSLLNAFKFTQQQPQPVTRQAGGKKIQMRTYHFLKYKKYSERAFIAERPIIAADNAYDFMKLHYDIGNKQVTFTIHNRVNNKKYKYIAKTLKDGTNVIKSAK